MFKALLIYPPVWKLLAAPYFSLPPVAAFLKENGVNVKTVNLNIETINEAIKTEFLKNKIKLISDEYEKLNSSVLDEDGQIQYITLINLLFSLGSISDKTEYAKNVLNQNDFYNFDKFLQAHLILNTLVECISQAEILVRNKEGELYKNRNSVKNFVEIIRNYENKFSLVSEYLKQRVKELIELEKPDLIGISVTTNPRSFLVFLIAKFIKENTHQ